MLKNKRNQVNRVAVIACMALLDATRPRDVGVNSLLLFGAEKAGIAFIAQDSQAGFFMQNFTTERVDHTHSPIAHRTHDGLIQPTAFDQFTNEHTLIDQCDREIASDKAAIAVLDLSWVSNDTLQALRLEIVLK